MWINPTTMQVFKLHQDIRAAFPNTSLPSVLTDEVLSSIGIEPVAATPHPAFGRLTHKVVEVIPVVADDAWHQQWQVVPLTQIEVAAVVLENRAAAKQAREAAVNNIKVTTAAGHTFDGDETSQTRMARAITVLSTGAAASVPWVLANNTVIQATAAELTEALALAGAEQARLWVLP